VRKLFSVRFLLLNRGGFTLTELLVALAVSGVLVVGLAAAYTVQKGTYEDEASLRDLQMNGRIAVDQVARVIRNAGLGCRENFPPEGSDTVQGASRNATRIFQAQNATTGPDTLTVVTGLASRTQIQTDSEGSVFRLASMDGFDLTTGRYIYVAPFEKNRFLKILAISGPDVTVSESRSVFAGYKVFRVNLYTITLDQRDRDTPIDVDGDGSTGDNDGDEIPDLAIFDNAALLTDESLSEVAEGIEDLQFQYGWDANENGTIDPAEFVDDPTGNEERIQAVRIFLLARSLLPDPHFKDDTGTYTIADRTILLDTNDANGIDSDFDHHFHRQLFVETVMVRNRNL
jgi:prepilin-type N-terminal cleavage/methylation domain-containing protein